MDLLAGICGLYSFLGTIGTTVTPPAQRTGVPVLPAEPSPTGRVALPKSPIRSVQAARRGIIMPLRTIRLPLYRYGLAIGLALACAAGALAQKEKKDEAKLPVPSPAPVQQPEIAPPPADPVPGTTVTRYTLPEALSIGLTKHPQIAALKSSMNAALMKHRGLDEVKRMVGILQPDIKYREEQSDLGLKAAMAEYEQAQFDVTFAVVRCYYTVVYAREQSRVARELVDQLEANLEQVRKIVEDKKGGTKTITANTLSNLTVVLGEAKGRMILAESGADRARAALREAMGLEPGARVDAADEVLPEVSRELKLNRDTIIAHAVTRRGEVKLAQMGADVTRLEAYAQWSRKFMMLGTTFANAADIHARPIPAASHDPEYKPGAIGPEMPDRLVGRPDTRTAIASIYADRANSAADQARSLVCLEAENAYFNWVAATRAIDEARREAAKEGRALKERLREAAGGIQTKEEVLTAEVSATLAIAELNKARYEQIIALSNLERITAGGIRVNFPGR
jgi:hypothetical protein